MSPLSTERKAGTWDFPGGPVVSSPPANAGVTGLIPGPGGSYMPWGAWTCVPQLLKPARSRARAPQQEKPLQREAHSWQLEGSPHLPQLERVQCGNKDPVQPKIISR